MKSNGSDFGFFPCTFIGDNNQNDDDHGDDDDDDQDDDCKGEQQRVKVGRALIHQVAGRE